MESFWHDLLHGVERALTSPAFLTAVGIRVVDFAIRVVRERRRNRRARPDSPGANPPRRPAKKTIGQRLWRGRKR
jgi:hypothetical protein